MKTTLLLILLAICSSFASADPIIFTNQYGSVTVNTFGIQSTQSELTSFDGIKPTKGALGYVNYGTGALVSGSIADGGTFSSQGSYRIGTEGERGDSDAHDSTPRSIGCGV
jgi:hypothetical protein